MEISIEVMYSLAKAINLPYITYTFIFQQHSVCSMWKSMRELVSEGVFPLAATNVCVRWQHNSQGAIKIPLTLIFCKKKIMFVAAVSSCDELHPASACYT